MSDETLDGKLLRRLREKKRVHADDKPEEAEISGTVMGYNDDQYIRPLFPATVFLKVAIGDAYFNPTDEEDAKKLQGDHSIVWQELSDCLQSFEPYQIPEWKAGEPSPMGYFEFKVPISERFGYCVFATIEEETRSMLDGMGENGLGTNANILGTDLAGKKDLGGIIVAFYDKWVPEPPPEKLKPTSPPTPDQIRDMMKDGIK